MNDSIPNEDELELINRFSRRKLTAQEVYVFPVTLCDNEIDRDFERFSIPALHKLAKLFDGRTGISDHSGRSRDQKARVFMCEVVTDRERKTVCGEPYTYLRAKAYTLRTEANEQYIAEIDAGIKKETSVGCAVKSKVCSVCGKSLFEGCEHRRGQIYGGQVCHTVLEEPIDAYEWSFVAVPAQKEAGVTKSLSGGGEENGVYELARYGAVYRGEIFRSVVRSVSGFLPELETEQIGKMCGGLSFDALLELKKALDARNSARLAPLQFAQCRENIEEYKV